MLIKAYGEFWKPDVVTWGARGKGRGGQLLGDAKEAKEKMDKVDHWAQSGIYVLYNEYEEIVYVGQARQNDLGSRLRNHLSDHLAERWRSFSWYGRRPVQPNGKLGHIEEKPISHQSIISELEAILMSAANPQLNKQAGQFGTDVVKFKQHIPDEEATPIAQRTYQKLAAIESKIAELEQQLKSVN